MDRLNDPVWQAFEREPPPDARPLTEEQFRKRERGLREMRQGLFVKIEQLVKE
jgi:hypothetical protein